MRILLNSAALLLAGTMVASCGAPMQNATPVTGGNAPARVAMSSNAAPHTSAPKFFAWGTIPAGTAGTAFASPQTLKLTVEDANGTPITGTYSPSVSVTDSDTSSTTQGSLLILNGAAGSRTVTLTKSTDVLKLKYGGLAMKPVTLKAAATGAAAVTASFAPTLKPIVYTGSKGVLSNQEIDLYNPTNGQTGNSGSFTLTQPGWKGGTFNNTFTYALGGSGNNCSSFSVTPASGTAAAYTVTAQVSAVSGTCILTVTGGGGVPTVPVTLTYSTSGIGFN